MSSPNDCPNSVELAAQMSNIASHMPFEMGTAKPTELLNERLQGFVWRYSTVTKWGFIRSSAFFGDLFFHIDEVMEEFQTARDEVYNFIFFM